MTITNTYYLAPNARWQGRDATGQPLVGGKVETYQAGTLIPQATYSDPMGVNLNANPVILDAKGEANIYWVNNIANPVLYYIRVYDALGNLVYDQDNYPTLIDTNIEPIPVDDSSIINLARNPQFSLWSTSTNWPNYGSSQNSYYDYVADDWVFQRSNLNATINIMALPFQAGQTQVPFNPLYYFHYECTNAGAGGETLKVLGQLYESVQTLSGQTVTISFWARTLLIGSLSVSFLQFFGTGGSSSVFTTAGTIPVLTTAWAPYSFTVTIPSINGKTVATDFTDALALHFNFPLNSIATVEISSVFLQTGSAATEFPYLTIDEQQKHTDYNVTQSLWYTGDVKDTFRNVADPGWLLLSVDNQTIGSQTSGATYAGGYVKALYTILWNNVSNTYCPVTGGRGASSELDFNANKKLQLPLSQNRVLAQTDNATNPLGSTAGGASTTLSQANLPAFQVPLTEAAGHGASPFNDSSASYDNNIWTISGGTTGPVHLGGPIGSGTAFENRQPTLYVNYMIKL